MERIVVKREATSRDRGERVVEFAAGDTIFREGDLGTEMFIIRGGRVEILQLVNGEDRQIAVLEKGDFFGEMSILEELPRSATARAMTPVRLVRINGAAFDSMLRRNPEVGVRIMRKLSRRVRDTDQLLREALGQQEIRRAVEEGTPKSTVQQPVHGGTLVHEPSGVELPLGDGRVSTVGRRDPVTGVRPDIDLTAIDTERSSSRTHARIQVEEGKFFIVESVGTTNGTFVNGARLQSGVAFEIRDGDTIRFGLVELTFRAG